MISAGIAQIAPATTSFIQASSAASDLFETIDRVPQMDSSADVGNKPSEIHGHVVFRNVSFSYPSRPHIPILKSISFDVPANKVTALVGASGSGKSTVISLLERWYEPNVSIFFCRNFSSKTRLDHGQLAPIPFPINEITP